MENSSLTDSQPSQAPLWYSARAPEYEWSGSWLPQPWYVVRWYVGCGAPVRSGYARPAWRPLAPGSQPRKWSKDRFSMHSTTMWSMPAEAGGGRVAWTVAERLTVAASLAPVPSRGLSAAAPATEAPPSRI